MCILSFTRIFVSPGQTFLSVCTLMEFWQNSSQGKVGGGGVERSLDLMCLLISGMQILPSWPISSDHCGITVCGIGKGCAQSTPVSSSGQAL